MAEIEEKKEDSDHWKRSEESNEPTLPSALSWGWCCRRGRFHWFWRSLRLFFHVSLRHGPCSLPPCDFLDWTWYVSLCLSFSEQRRRKHTSQNKTKTFEQCAKRTFCLWGCSPLKSPHVPKLSNERLWNGENDSNRTKNSSKHGLNRIRVYFFAMLSGRKLAIASLSSSGFSRMIQCPQSNGIAKASNQCVWVQCEEYACVRASDTFRSISS
jgi:hypothetical protein